MNKLKLILIGMGVVFAAILAYFAVSLFLSLFWYIVVFGVVALAGYGAYKVLSNPKKQQLNRGTPENELMSAQRVLREIEQKYLEEKK